MRPDRNTIHASWPAAFPLALNRAEEKLPAGAELALCFVSLPAASASGVPEWIELVPANAVSGADGRAFVNDKPEDFLALSAQLKRIQAGWCVDFDHQLQLAANEKVGGTAPAAGWIVELENRKGSIWGRVEWTDLGTEAIEKKRYRGISPVFAYDKDSKRALGLVSAALTNNPNLDLVALNSRTSEGGARQSQQEKPDMDWLKKQLGLAEDATEDQVKTAANAALALVTALASAIGVDLKAAVALNAETLKAALAKRFGSNDVLVALCTKAGVNPSTVLGTGADAGVDAIVAGLGAALQTPDPAKFVPMEAHTALKTELDRLKGGQPAELVDQALKDGRLYPAQKEWALNYAQRDLEGFKKYVASSPPALKDAKAPTTGALDVSDAKAIAANAAKYVAEQAKLGIVVSTTQAVAHVTQKAS